MDNWKEKVLTSVKGIERAQPPVDSFAKIQLKIQTQKLEGRTLNPLQWVAAAASIALVVGGNLFFLLSYPGQASTPIDGGTYSELVSDFNIYADES